MVEVGEICKTCKYWSHRTKTCDYTLITGASRTITNNVRNDPRFCDKYIKGEKIYEQHDWNEGWYRE